MQECDVLLAVGARFDDRVIGNPDHFLAKPKKIIHIDIDRASISKRVKIDVPIVGDVKLVLEDLISAFKGLQGNSSENLRADWLKMINLWKQKDCMKYEDDGTQIKPQKVIQKLHEVTNGEAFITSDVGQHQMWAAQYYPFDKPRRWIVLCSPHLKLTYI